MRLNYKKTKVMLFNPCRKIDFMPELRIGYHELDIVDEIRLVGLVIRSLQILIAKPTSGFGSSDA